MKSTNSPQSDTRDREIAHERVFDAPRELVYDAWADPKHISNWWGPYGFTTTTHEMDFRPGGTWRFTMHGPDGVDYPNIVVYRVLDRPERIEYDHMGGEGFDDIHFQAYITFAVEGKKTRLRFRMVFATAELRDDIEKRVGAYQGLLDLAERLAEHLAKFRPSAPNDSTLSS